LILYLDTSALIKLYVTEPGSDETESLRAQADLVATVMITYAEAAAAFARRIREQPVMVASLSLARDEFFADWPLYLSIPIDQRLLHQAARLADAFALRGYDSVQLAAAHILQLQGVPRIVFASFDERLATAASLIGLDSPFMKSR
jgi:predicted nucleic acid-binding protein